MGILSSLTFPRAMIFGTLVGSLITGWFVYQRTAELHELETDVRQAELVVRSIQMKAQELDQLESAANREGLKGDDKEGDEPASTPLPRTEAKKDKIVS